MSIQSRAGTVPYQLYQYVPRIAPAIITITVFTILTMTHFYRVIRTRMWFCIPFVVGGLFETVGYVGRALGHSSPESKTPYIIQSLLILVAPALFAATIYMTLGRLMRWAKSEKHSLIRASWLTKLFVVGDVLSFFIQGGGGGILASNPNKVKLGENIIIGGLFFQICVFGIFILVSFVLHVRMKSYPTQQSCSPDLKWEKMLLVLYTVSAIIMVRNIFRVVEYIGGRDGPLLSIEWPIYVFDALLMATTMVVFFFGYPTLICAPVHDAENVELPSAPSKEVFGNIRLAPRNQGWRK